MKLVNTFTGELAETHAAYPTVVTSMSKLANISEASDQEVVTWAREGDEHAYRKMVRRYGPPVFDLIYRMVGQRELAEDLTQETFVKAFRALDRNGPERKPSAWILRIANNTAIDYVRRKRPEYRRCFTLRHMERRSCHEIATKSSACPWEP
jgi:DNA-directed RNA polymerase specialized sigma subunit